MKKLTQIALVLATIGSAALLTACGDEENKSASTSAQLNSTSKNLETTSDAKFEDAVEIAIANTEAYKKEDLYPGDVKLAPKQEIRYNQYSMPYTLDPTLASYSSDFDSIKQMFDTLMRQHRSGEMVKVLAEDYSVSEDGLTWTFNIRKDADWSDGKPVRAQDFVYAWRRLADPSIGSNYAFFLVDMNVKNAEEVTSGALGLEELGVEATDDKTFVVHLSKPTPWLEDMLGQINLAALRQDVIEKYGKEWTKPENIVVNGPFKLTKYLLNDTIEYDKRDDYWGKDDVIINKIKYDFIQNDKVGYYNYIKGMYPTSGIPKDLKDLVIEERPGELIYIYRPNIAFFKVNAAKITDPKVRRAISLLINRRILVSKIIGSGEATSKLGPNQLRDGQLVAEAPWFNNSYAENAKEAIKLLTEAGYTPDKPFVLNYLTSSSEGDKKIAIALNSFLADGSGKRIKLETEYADAKSIYDRVATKNFDFVRGGWLADFNHISNFYTIYTCNSSQNELNYCNPKFDALLEKALAEKDPTKRAELYKEADRLVTWEDAVIIPTQQTRQFLIKSPSLHGYAPWLMNRYFRDWFFIDGKEVAPTGKSE